MRIGQKADHLTRCYRRIVVAQLGLAVLVIVLSAVFSGIFAAMSCGFGSLLALVNTWVARRSVRKSSDLAYASPELGMLPLFSGLIQRLLLFALGVVFGVTVLHLLPLYLLIGFIVLQVGYLAC